MSTLKHLRSSTADKRPAASGLADGQIAINTASGTPGLYVRDNASGIVKIGPAHVGTTAPNAVPAGSAGNTRGELWVDISTTTAGLKYFNGSSFVNLTPSGTTTVVGLVELATAAETQTGTDGVRAVTPSGLQSKMSNSTSTTSSTTIASATAVKTAYDLADAALPKSGGIITGELLISPSGSLVFEGSSDDSFETTLAVVNPTADRTITLPNTTGTVVTTGDSGTITSAMIANGAITNDDINASAAIVDTKLGTISTAGKVSNSATTATNANTINTIVARDGSGNFSAGTISASLTGAASLNVLKAGDTMTGALSVPSGSASTPSLYFGANINTGLYSPAANNLAFSTTGSERARIDNGGRLLVGTSSELSVNNVTAGVEVHSTTTNSGASVSIAKFNNDTSGPQLILGKSRNSTIAAGTIVQGNDDLGLITFNGDDGTDLNTSAARIQAFVDGTPGTNDMPGRLVFSTTADGASSPTERMRIDSSGFISLGGDTNTGLSNPSADNLAITTGGSERARIDSSGRLLVGTSTARTVQWFATTYITPLEQVAFAGHGGLGIFCNADSGSAGALYLNKSRGSSVGDSVIVQSGDVLGEVIFTGNDGTNFLRGASIEGVADGSPGSGDMPGRLAFRTRASSTSAPTEAFRITSDNVLCYHQAFAVTRSATTTLTTADLKNGIITSAPASGITLTLPTGTDAEAGFSGIYTNMTFEWSIINTAAANNVTVSGNTGHTIVGSATVAAQTSARYASRRSGTNTFVTYRLS